MATIEVTAENFNDIITNNEFVIVDFWAPWCGPCKGFAPVYEELSEKYPDLVFAKVNTENEQQLAGEFQIRSIPTLMIFREQIILFSQPGALQGAQLEQVIDQAKGLDMEEVKMDIEKQQAEQATKQ
ncbi:thioredoxin [sulfur-oxidizing endosymbiont of Gigantopelta aegis]|uniref:thioredoxin n=1 Tax=sulfur-oxidizing endosymbiont of Gigantopelta aegis TaxID=2794934 RepID=UPI0018DC49E0|nr:thioredoxin [sulfur-oxidizing endosymbiont of Gigantopelta aegis]